VSSNRLTMSSDGFSDPFTFDPRFFQYLQFLNVHDNVIVHSGIDVLPEFANLPSLRSGWRCCRLQGL
jgi:hypothetical protein